jgi:hypothetical protein
MLTYRSQEAHSSSPGSTLASWDYELISETGFLREIQSLI